MDGWNDRYDVPTAPTMNTVEPTPYPTTTNNLLFQRQNAEIGFGGLQVIARCYPGQPQHYWTCRHESRCECGEMIRVLSKDTAVEEGL